MMWAATALGMATTMFMECNGASGVMIGMIVTVQQLAMATQIPAALFAERLTARKKYWAILTIIQRVMWFAVRPPAANGRRRHAGDRRAEFRPHPRRRCVLVQLDGRPGTGEDPRPFLGRAAEHHHGRLSAGHGRGRLAAGPLPRSAYARGILPRLHHHLCHRRGGRSHDPADLRSSHNHASRHVGWYAPAGLRGKPFDRAQRDQCRGRSQRLDDYRPELHHSRTGHPPL